MKNKTNKTYYIRMDDEIIEFKGTKEDMRRASIEYHSKRYNKTISERYGLCPDFRFEEPNLREAYFDLFLDLVTWVVKKIKSKI